MEKNLADFSDDSYLLEEIKRGNEEAFVYLFKNYFPRLRGYAIRFIEDEEIVRDIIQECFLKFWEKREFVGLHNFFAVCNGAQRMPELPETRIHCREAPD